MAGSLAILRSQISRLATRFARYALPTLRLAAPERAFPHEYESKVDTKMLAFAANGGETADWDWRRKATRSREGVKFCAEPEWPQRDRHETPNRDQPP